MRAIVLYPGEDGYWIAECPSLPGCISQGRTKPEALANIKEAIEGWLETAEAHGQPIPEERFEFQVAACDEASCRLAFEELRRIAEEEDYTLEIPPRQERSNPFPEALDELSR